MSGNIFTQVFVINRFLNNKSCSRSLLFLLDEDEQHTLKQLKDNGIKDYFENNFNQDADTISIHNTFSTIINTFPKQYHNIVSYDKRSNYNRSYYYYKLLFKQGDLVKYIFQYLGDIGSINNCSFVDSIWLLNAFGSKCHSYLSNYSISRLLYIDQDKSNRIWQRFTDIKHCNIHIYEKWIRERITSNGTFAATMEKFVNHIKMIKMEQAQSISIHASIDNHDFNTNLIKIICDRLSQNGRLNNAKVESFELVVADPNKNNEESKDEDTESNITQTSSSFLKLDLTSCDNVTLDIDSQQFECQLVAVVSKKSKQLSLGNDCLIDIKHDDDDNNDGNDSDVGNVEQLRMHNVKFKWIKNTQDFVKFSKQFRNIKTIKFRDQLTRDMIKFWICINENVINCKCKESIVVDVKVDEILAQEEKYGIFRMVGVNNLKISNLSIDNIDGETQAFVQESVLTMDAIKQHVKELKLMIIQNVALQMFATKCTTPTNYWSNFENLKCVKIDTYGCPVYPNLLVLTSIIQSLIFRKSTYQFMMNQKKAGKFKIKDSNSNEINIAIDHDKKGWNEIEMQVLITDTCSQQTTDDNVIDAFLNQQIGLYRQFSIFLNVLKLAIQFTIPISFGIIMQICHNDINKIEQCADMFAKIKDELWMPFLNEHMEYPEKRSDNVNDRCADGIRSGIAKFQRPMRVGKQSRQSKVPHFSFYASSPQDENANSIYSMIITLNVVN